MMPLFLAAAEGSVGLSSLLDEVMGGFQSFAGSLSGFGFAVFVVGAALALVGFGYLFVQRPGRSAAGWALGALAVAGAVVILAQAARAQVTVVQAAEMLGRSFLALPDAARLALGGALLVFVLAAILALAFGSRFLSLVAVGMPLAGLLSFPAAFLAWRVFARLGVQDAGAGRESEFELLHAPPGYAIVLFLAVPLAIFVLSLYRGERREAPWRARLMLAFVRLEIVALILFLLFTPVIAGLETKIIQGAAVVLIDDSLSMQVRAPREHYGDSPTEARLSGLSELVAAQRSARLRRRLETALGADCEALRRFDERRAERDALRRRLAQLEQQRRAALSAGSAEALSRADSLENERQAAARALRAALDRKPDLTGVEDRAELSRLDAETLLRSLAELEEGASRLDLALEILDPRADRERLARFVSDFDRVRPILQALAEGNQVHLFAFSAAEGDSASVLRPITTADFDTLRPRGHETRLCEALVEAAERVKSEDREQPLVEVLILTDGRRTRHTLEVDEALERLGAVQHERPTLEVIGLGNPKHPRDVELISVEGPAEIILGERVELTLTVKATGFPPGERSAVILTRDEIAPLDPNRVIAYDELSGVKLEASHKREGVAFDLPDTGRIRKLTLRFQPKEEGSFTYFAKLGDGPKPDEQNFDNNVRPFNLQVTDRKIRVLYVEDRPRYDFRHLIFAIQRDPNLEFRAFLISADPGWPQPISTWWTEDSDYPRIERLRELPRPTPFEPGTRPSYEDLAYYDVVVLGDVPRARFSDRWLEGLEDFVKSRHGGLIVQAGPGSMPGEYRGTPLEKLLPVSLQELGHPPPLEDAGYKHFLSLTPDGRAHPVMRLESDPALLDLLFSDREEEYSLPPLYWFAPRERTKAGATVLARHRDLKGDHGALYPMIAYQHYETGMVFYVAFEGLWRWKKFRGDEPYFYPFWQRVLRFVCAERLSHRQEGFELYTDKKTYELGEQVECYGRVEGEAAQQVLRREDGDRTVLPARIQRDLDLDETTELDLTMDSPAHREHRGRFRPSVPGLYRAWLPGLAASEESPHRFEVTIPIEEFRDITQDTDTLRRLSRQGGHLYSADEAAAVRILQERKELPRKLPPRFWWKEERQYHDLLVFGFLMALLTFEWAGRKIMQLI